MVAALRRPFVPAEPAERDVVAQVHHNNDVESRIALTTTKNKNRANHIQTET